MKKIITLLFVLTMIFTFAACGEESNSKKTAANGGSNNSSDNGSIHDFFQGNGNSKDETPDNDTQTETGDAVIEPNDPEQVEPEIGEPTIENPGNSSEDTPHTHDLKTVETKAATCTADGVMTTTCSKCSYKATAVINKLGHSYKYANGTAPTINTMGNLKGTCKVCSATTTVKVPALTTTDFTKKETKAATCTAAGTNTWTWKNTTYGTVSYTTSIAAKGHSTTTTTKAATCTAAGTKTTTCSKCTYKTTENIAKLGHDLKTTTKAATCTVAGSKTTTCSRCTYKTTENIAALGHNLTTTTKAATCITAGTKTTTCSRCTYKTTENIAKLAHNYKYAKNTTPSTTTTGSLKGTCQKCYGTTTVTIPKLTTADYTKTVTKAATCTATGTDTWTLRTTTYGTFSYAITSAAKGHDYENIVTRPTCVKEGYTTHTCTRCSNKYVDSYTPVKDHNFKITTVSGGKEFSCSGCKQKITQANNIVDYYAISNSAYWKDQNLYVQFALVNTNSKAYKVTSVTNIIFKTDDGKQITVSLDWKSSSTTVAANGIHIETLILNSSLIKNYGIDVSSVGMSAGKINGSFV